MRNPVYWASNSQFAYLTHNKEISLAVPIWDLILKNSVYLILTASLCASCPQAEESYPYLDKSSISPDECYFISILTESL